MVWLSKEVGRVKESRLEGGQGRLYKCLGRFLLLVSKSHIKVLG